MGTKGRDIALWLYFAFSLGSIIKTILVYPAFVCLLALGYFYLFEKPRAILYRQMRLLPVNKYVAKLLIFNKIKGWDDAYEVHINFTKKPLKVQLKNIQQDICEIIGSRPGLYIWESHINPIKFLWGEKLVMVKEGPFLPRPPMVYRKYPKNRLCHGVVLVNKNRGEDYA